MGLFDFLYTPNLSKQDRARVDSLIKFFNNIEDAFARLRKNEEVVVRITIEPRKTKSQTVVRIKNSESPKDHI